MNDSPFKVASAWLPMAMSALALIIVAGHVLAFGAAREADEGAAAHLWQLLLAGQVPIIGWFLVRWGAENPRKSAVVLALQAAAIFVAAAPVFLLRL